MQFAPITINDGISTDLVFNPRDVTNGVATLVKSNGIPIADKRISVANTRTAQGKYKTTIKIAVPVVQDVVVNGVSRPTVVRSSYVDLTFSSDQTATDLERHTARSLLIGFLESSTGTKAVNDLETFW